MTRWSLVLVLLMSHVVIVSAQQPTSTWPIAKPVVEKWDTEYRNSGRSLASRTKIVAQIHQLLQTHHTEIWAYEAAALGFNHLNLNDDAVSVIRNYLQRFPEGYFVLHISLNFFALRKHHRVKTFKWDNCFGNGG